VDSSNPWINVNGDQPLVFVGLNVQKMGHFGGWTYGTVTATCQDLTMLDGSTSHVHKVLCKHSSSTWMHEGDSGGPIFTWDGADGGSFLGLTSAYPCAVPAVSCSTESWSPLSQIELDLGSLTVESEISVGTPSVSGSLVSGNPSLSWSSVSTTNTNGATTHYHILRAIWDASTYTWTDPGSEIADITSTSYTDSGLPFTPTSYTGQSKPADCTYTQAYYWVAAYNSGIYSQPSLLQYYQGPADGPNPGGRECQP
jgi:hypothetical protein